MKEWNDFLSHLEEEWGSSILQKWVPPLIRFDAANIYLQPKDSFQANWFEEHIRPRLKGFVNANQRAIKVHLVSEKKEMGMKQKESFLSFIPDPIDPEMSFENFIPAEPNLIPYKLLSQGGDFSFNPIYLYGSKGSGKTHLLMGAAQAFQRKGKKVFFVNGETFTGHVVQAIRLGLMREFRKVYRDIDFLIVDDIHLFSRKGATQEEFFHTFNTLHTLGLPILLSANSSPFHLREIEPRLISRFEWGISLEVGKSDLGLVLEKKAALWGFDLRAELKQWILEQFPYDPILALQALVVRCKETLPTLSIAERLLKDLLQQEEIHAYTPEKIIKTIAAHFGITTSDILGKSQTRSAALPRQIAMYFCRQKLELPFQKIGEIFQRDHSTVMSSIKQIQEKLEKKELVLSDIFSAGM